MKYEKIISGKEIILRSIELTDCTERYVNWLQNTEINTFLESRLSVQTLETITRFVLDIVESKDNYMFAIIHKETGKHIGNIKIGPIHPVYKRADIGYLLGEREYWKGTIATDALYCIIKFGFDILKLHKITAGVIVPNLGAILRLEKLGFKKEGCLRDHVFQGDKYLDTYLFGLMKNELIPLG